MSSQVLTPNTETAILARVLQSEEGEITSEVASYLLSMKLPSFDEKRVSDLSAKADQGFLKEDETQELDSYLHVGMLLGVMQSRARRLLKRASDFAQQRIGNSLDRFGSGQRTDANTATFRNGRCLYPSKSTI
jgi:hypothetical protein